jgi:hypothetical protein
MRVRNENDWIFSTDPDEMLRALTGKRKLTPRKQRLFCVGCCRQILDAMEEVCRRAVEMAERYADGEATLEEMTAARDAGMRRNRSRFDIHGFIRAMKSPEKAAQTGMARRCWEATEATTRPRAPVPGKVIQAVGISQIFLETQGSFGFKDSPALAGVLRDVAGNPFRPPTFDPVWRTANVAGLAGTIYQQRTFDRMPILGDALEEAGCTDPAMLAHCREAGPHVRGCWVLDLLLGKS